MTNKSRTSSFLPSLSSSLHAFFACASILMLKTYPSQEIFFWSQAQMDVQMNVPAGGFNRINGSSVTDAVLGAMFIAGRSCGPPNALSSSTLAAIQQKYVESVCYYAGPIFRTITDNNTVDIPCYNSTFEADILLVRTVDYTKYCNIWSRKSCFSASQVFVLCCLLSTTFQR